MVVDNVDENEEEDISEEELQKPWSLIATIKKLLSFPICCTRGKRSTCLWSQLRRKLKGLQLLIRLEYVLKLWKLMMMNLWCLCHHLWLSLADCLLYLLSFTLQRTLLFGIFNLLWGHHRKIFQGCRSSFHQESLCTCRRLPIWGTSQTWGAPSQRVTSRWLLRCWYMSLLGSCGKSWSWFWNCNCWFLL